MAIVRVPTPLRSLTDGASSVSCRGASVREVVVSFDAAYPGVGRRILDDAGELHRFVNMFVGEEDIRDREGLETAVTDADVVSIVPAVAGG
jgi:molybdopterin synthase sulfur carrier subunit